MTKCRNPVIHAFIRAFTRKNRNVHRITCLLIVCSIALSPFPAFAVKKRMLNTETLVSMTQAAEGGDRKAQYLLGSLYCTGMRFSDGMTIAQDTQKCVTFLTRSAQQGYVSAQTSLGVLYNSGEIVPQDYAQSYYWLSLAALQDDKAAASRDIVAKKLSPDQLNDVRRQVQNNFVNRNLSPE